MTRRERASTASHGVILRPDWLVPVDSPAIRDGYLVVVAGSIEHLGNELPERFRSLPCIRLAQTAILPGWVNSHCHLEFSDLDTPIGTDGSFDAWLRRVMEQRAATASQSIEDRVEQRRAAIRRGLIESWSHGVRWVIDNITPPWIANWVADVQSEIRSGLGEFAASTLVPESLVMVQPCFEWIDVRKERWQQTSSFAYEQIDAPKCEGVGRCGLAPHAPYTASLHVTRNAAIWSQSHAGLVSMHLAETPEELQWLDHRRGTLGEWIAPKLDADHISNVGSIDEHLAILASCWRALVVHGNYLTMEQIEFLAEHRERMAIVVCPRTHDWFGHAPHPVVCGDVSGTRVLLGTDSRASNPDLNLWDEVRTAVRWNADASGNLWTRRITTDAAHLLDLPRGIGRMCLGGASLLTAMRWNELADGSQPPRRSERELWEWMVQYGRPYPLEKDLRIDPEHAALAAS
jgi:cytosine/adenosine deaminase-related metal-dependent hydrolase